MRSARVLRLRLNAKGISYQWKRVRARLCSPFTCLSPRGEFGFTSALYLLNSNIVPNYLLIVPFICSLVPPSLRTLVERAPLPTHWINRAWRQRQHVCVWPLLKKNNYFVTRTLASCSINHLGVILWIPVLGKFVEKINKMLVFWERPGSEVEYGPGARARARAVNGWVNLMREGVS